MTQWGQRLGGQRLRGQRLGRALVIAAICALAVLPAQRGAADPDRISVLLGSKHVGATGFNEINPGLFLTWEHERWAFTAGGYLNSYERGSLAAVGQLPLFRWRNGELSAFAGLAWYPGDAHLFETRIAGDIVGIGGLNLRQGPVFVQVFPLVTGGAKGLFTAGLTWELP